MLNFARKHRYLSAFTIGTLLYLLAVLPALAYRGGFFYYFGDYVFQTIEFYTSAHQAVLDGYIWWNPNIELGAPMAEAYGFYLWGSPFFWISMLIPTAAVPYALPVIMALRYGAATCTAFLWARQFTRSNRAALIAALLYAFSGFQANNIVFSHFHDVTAFFPLFLYAFDCLMQDKRHAGTFFALMTALMACINYYFFFGEVIFLLLYWVVRYRTWRPRSAREAIRSIKQEVPPKERGPLLQKNERGRVCTRTSIMLLKHAPDIAWQENQRSRRNRHQFLCALGYGTLGVLLAAAFLVQTVLGTAGNSRVSDTLSGDSLLAFSDAATPWGIIRSIFLVPELMGRQTLFNVSEISWASVSLYLPCFSIAGVIAYVLQRRSNARRADGSTWMDWKIKLVLILAVMAFVPALSALFSAMNSTFYARWYYLPILIMAVMTAQALEEATLEQLRLGAKIVIPITLFFLIFPFLPGRDNSILGGLISIPDNVGMFALIAVSTLAMLVFLGLMLYSSSKYPPGHLTSWGYVAVVAFCCFISTGCVLLDGCLVYSNAEAHNFEVQCLQNKPEIDESVYSRIETDDSAQNWALIWGFPVNRTFLSTPAGSTFDIYEAFEDGRMQESNIDMSHMGLRHLMSTRYYLRNVSIVNEAEGNVFASLLNVSLAPKLIYDEDEEMSKTPRGYERTNESDGFAVFETQHFIPMAFTFDSYIRDRAYDQIRHHSNMSSAVADRLLVKDLILTDEQADTYGHLLQEDTEMPTMVMSVNDFNAYADARAASAATTFTADPGGYSATITLPKENLVFFSVPYDRGFKAYVDGEPATIERVDYGFMAVPVSAGTHEIRLAWSPWGLEVGVALSVLAAIVLVVLHVGSSRARK